MESKSKALSGTLVIRERIEKTFSKESNSKTQKMLDICLPIGLLLLIYGIIITSIGIINPVLSTPKSVQLNVNLIWGIVIFLISIIFLFISYKNKSLFHKE